LVHGRSGIQRRQLRPWSPYRKLIHLHPKNVKISEKPIQRSESTSKSNIQQGNNQPVPKPLISSIVSHLQYLFLSYPLPISNQISRQGVFNQMILLLVIPETQKNQCRRTHLFILSYYQLRSALMT